MTLVVGYHHDAALGLGLFASTQLETNLFTFPGFGPDLTMARGEFRSTAKALGKKPCEPPTPLSLQPGYTEENLLLHKLCVSLSLTGDAV